MQLVHRAGLEPAKPEGTWFTVRPRCRLSICAEVVAGQDLHLRPPGYEPGELLLLYPASHGAGDREDRPHLLLAES